MGVSNQYFRVTVYKRFDLEEWSNVYRILATSLGDAHGVAGQIAQIERAVHTDRTTFLRYRTDDGQKDTDVFMVTEWNQPGAWGATGHDHLPLHNRVVVDFNVAGGGRPSRKFICPPLIEAEQANGTLQQGCVDRFNAQYIAPLIALGVLVDPDNQQWISGSVKRRVGMRQLRRKRKKKAGTGTTL